MCLKYSGHTKTESTAFLVTLYLFNTQSMPGKAVDLGYVILHSLPYKILTNKAKMLNVLSGNMYKVPNYHKLNSKLAIILEDCRCQNFVIGDEFAANVWWWALYESWFRCNGTHDLGATWIMIWVKSESWFGCNVDHDVAEVWTMICSVKCQVVLH